MAYQGFHLSLSGADIDHIDYQKVGGEHIDYQKMEGEADMIRILTSFFPVIGVFVAERYPSVLTQIGAKVSAYSTLLFIVEFVFLRGESLFMITLFFLITLIVTTGVLLASGKSVDFLIPIHTLPGIREIQVYSKVLPLYLADV